MSERLLKSILIFVLSISLAFGYIFLCWRSHRIPNGPLKLSDCANPKKILPNSQRVIVLGDSLTHGTMSHHWLQDLQKKYGEKYSFINAGTNGDLAWNALQKTDQIIASQPSVVAIFIGGNDVLASLSPVWATSFVERKKLPCPPSVDVYKQNLEKIVVELQSNTEAQLVLFTLTLFGEDLNSLENMRMTAYSEIVIEIAEKYQINVVPIHQKLRHHLTMRQGVLPQSPNQATDYVEYRRLMRHSLIRYHFLFQSWDKISARHRYLIQTDGVHLNSQAARVIVAEFSKWLEEN